MARVKRGVIAGARHKKVLKKAKGYYNARRKVYRAAKQAVIKAGQYAYRDRKTNKRNMRSLWITRINAEARVHGLSYSKLIAGLNAGRSCNRSQGARRSGDERCGSLRCPRATGPGQSAQGGLRTARGPGYPDPGRREYRALCEQRPIHYKQQFILRLPGA